MKKVHGADVDEMGRIGRIISKDTQIITGIWLQKERHELSSARSAHLDELKNMIPRYLHYLGLEFASKESERLGSQRLAVNHGLQRWQVGWSLSELVQDYQLLQVAILEHLSACLNRPLTLEEMKAIGAYLDGAIRAAVVAYTDQSEQELRSLNESLEARVAERTRLAENQTTQLRQMAVDLIKAEQNERQRIARILHDDLQQLIAASRLRLEGLDRALPESDFIAERQTILEILEKAREASRHLAVELRPPVDTQNLIAILNWIKEQMQAAYELDVAVETDLTEAPVEQEMGLMLSQCLRELLFNVVKHAGCAEATVTLAALEDGRLSLSVVDAGAGFAPEAAEASADFGFGLTYIRERLQMIGGELDVWSAVGEGTRIRMTTPSQF